MRILHVPIAATRDLLLQHPLAGLHQARIGCRHAALGQRKHRVRRVPHGRHARLHAEGLLFLDAQLFELVHRANDLRIVERIAQAAQRNDGVHDAGIDRAQAVAHLQALQHPLLSGFERARAQRANVHQLEEVHQAIQHQEEIPPADQFLGPAQPQLTLGAPADEQLVDAFFCRNLLKWFLGVRDRQRHQDGARPRRNFVQVEPEPVGKQHDLRRNRRNGIVVVLAEEAQINLGEGVDLGHTTHRQDALARQLELRMIGRIARHLQREIRLHRRADVRRPIFVDRPAAIRVLPGENLDGALLRALRILGAEQPVQQDVIGDKRRIGAQLSAPVAFVAILHAEDELPRGIDRRSYTTLDVINFAETHFGATRGFCHRFF